MYLTGPPDATGRTLSVRRAGYRAFDGNSELASDPALRSYLTDLVGPYGLALREDLLTAGAGHSYGEMAEPLIEAVVPDDSPVDLLVLAYGIHDVRLGRATATYLASRCPGEPLSFAVCDQGAAIAFTALRLIESYAATGACRRALLVVAEQSALHYELATPAPVPERNAVVALLLEESAQKSVTVNQYTDVGPDNLDTLLRADIAESGATTVIVSAELAYLVRSIVDDPIISPDGQPYTGVWWELATRQAQASTVLLAEFDSTKSQRSLCTAAIRLDSSLAVRDGPRGGAEVINVELK